MGIPEGGLTAYANRMRESHQRLNNGWCSCDNPVCPARLLLDHIDDLVASYNLKVQDLARETARNAAAASLHRDNRYGVCETCLDNSPDRASGDCGGQDWPCDTARALGTTP